MVNPLKLQALLHWLAAGAPPQTDFARTVAELGRRLTDLGVEADFIGFYHTPKNPMLGGVRFSWTPRAGVIVREFSHEHMSSDYFIGGVTHLAKTRAQTVRYRVGEMPEFDDHPGSRPIIERGIREFICLPLLTTTIANAVFAVAVRREDGLPDDQFEACRRIAAPLARVVQSQIQQESADTLLATYLGRDAGRRVNAGMVKRGDAEMIRAVILFTDVTGFTALSNQLPIEETVAFLNRYFEALEQPILKNGGEVLKLIGDGMMAIFPTPDDLTAEEGAALSALSAVEDARAALQADGVDFRAAYHVGEIHYGNIGGLTRLDFTAIGPAVNLAARLLEAAAREGAPATCSAAFARLVPDRARPLGALDFKGFDKPEEVFDLS